MNAQGIKQILRFAIWFAHFAKSFHETGSKMRVKTTTIISRK